MTVPRSAEHFFDRSVSKRRRDIVTPEGVLLTVEVADVSDRATAFVIDFAIWFGATLFAIFPAILLMYYGLGGEIVLSLFILFAFIVRNTYFIHFELMWRGATPGKRYSGLRVIDRKGGPLLPSAIIARNLTREFEIFMPIGIILSLGGNDPSAFTQVLSSVWVLCIGALPFMNRDRMRGGDMIAGTMVIVLPKRELSKDIADAEFHYTFTDAHLSAYGTFELQVLEELLRQNSAPSATAAVNAKAHAHANANVMLHDVGEKIRKKIGWTQAIPLEHERLFLKDFYTAERAYLERGQLFGMVKADKNHERRRQEAPSSEREV